MIYDRRRLYLIAGLVAVLIFVGMYAATPRITPEMRVREQLQVLGSEPWTRIVVRQVQYVGGADAPSQVVVHGQRLADGSPVVVQFVADSPYSSPSAVRRLTEQPLEGLQADVQMIPRSLVQKKFRGAFQIDATHAGVALFAGFPDRPESNPGAVDNAPASSPQG